MRRILLLLAVVGGSLWMMALPAHASPPGAPVEVSCDELKIDPDPTFGVTFEGTIGDVEVSLPAQHVPGTNDSTADISAYTAGSGPIGYSITPIWSLPPNPYGLDSGPGTKAEGEITCHEAPTTSTTSSTVSVPPSQSKPTLPTPVSTSCSEPRGCCQSQCEGPPILPETGTDAGTLRLLGLGGSLLLAAGALSRRWKIQDRRG